MSGHVDSALFVYSEEAENYVDLVETNPHGIPITQVPIADFRQDPDRYLTSVSHLVISAQLDDIKEVMNLLIGRDISIGLLPLRGQRILSRCYAIPNDPEEMLSLALKDEPAEMDIVFCNDEILLFKGVIGRVPLFDSLSETGKGGIILSGVKRIFSLRLLPFSIQTNGELKKYTKTAASGCMIVENAEGSYASGMIDYESFIDDGMISALIVAPFSIMDYLKLMRLRVRSKYHVGKTETSIGFIKSSDMIIDSDNQMRVTIDGEKRTTTPAHFHVMPAAIKINRGEAASGQKRRKGDEKERHITKSLPAGKEVSVLSWQRSDCTSIVLLW